MSVPFARTQRSLRTDHSGASALSLIAGAALLGAWSAWAVFGSVAVYEVSPVARLEVARAAHPIQSPVAGRVTAVHLALGAAIAVGDPLFEIDAEVEKLKLAEARARQAALLPEIEALRRELATLAQARAVDSQGLPVAIGEAKARHEEAIAQVKLAEDHLERSRKLFERGALTKADLVRAEAELEQRRAAAGALLLAIGRTELTKRAEGTDRRAKGQSLERELVVLEGEGLTLSATIARLEHEIRWRTVRATVAGQVAELGTLTVGSMVQEGERVGAIVPAGDLKLFAEYPPHAAFGRIRVGQRARMRVEGFPWAQHGTVSATVDRVATEVRDGTIRVELAVGRDPASQIPLQHGLPGTVEIEVERASPASLLLRAAGKLVDAAPEVGRAP